MANRDDVTRELAECVDCGSVYAARQWPSGEIQPIGSDGCDCGSTDFLLIGSSDGESSTTETRSE
ncbi:hypothetical protein QQ977_10965 [Natrialbaceae archaeon AArc-T1-2]|nr:hypothetical protein [Natrialbaceae archaeon AArc-T1-2]WIV66210.1 hypothetical protein QQ977_10965 [Natrialbaceae archaeon AArc-T1-2]